MEWKGFLDVITDRMKRQGPAAKKTKRKKKTTSNLK